MNLQGNKFFQIISPQSVASSATVTSNQFDTVGFDELQIMITRETHATGVLSALTLQQSDTTDATNFANVTGYVAGTDFTLASIAPGTNTATATPAVFNFDLRGKKRYFRINATPSVAAGYMSATAQLSRASVTPITAANAGVTVLVNPS